jgi:two-component system, OmpR family, sensor kinase
VSRIPVRVRVAAAFALAMAVVLAGTGAFLYLRLGEHLSAALDRELRLRAYDLAAVVRDPDISLAAAGAGRFVESGESYAQLLDRRGRVVDASRPLVRTPLLSQGELRRAARATVFADRGPLPGLDEPSRILATPVRRRGRRMVLVVGATRENRAETLDSLEDELLIAGPAALVLASLAGYLLAGVSLQQVERMRRRAASISAARPGARLPVPPTRDELQRLGETLNAMLARLEQALARERDFVADAGHELRRPLALLRTELELALRHAGSEAELREAVRRSSAEVDRLAQLADDLLLIARSDQGQLPLRLETVEAGELLQTIASRFEWRAQEEERPLRALAPPGLELRGDPLRLQQALGNLVDNALRHGAGEVVLEAASGAGGVELHVRDEGPGFPPDFVPRAFERFARPGEARGGVGTGLGLSIVRVIAEAHGGSAHVANVGGGSDVWLALPARPDAAAP